LSDNRKIFGDFFIDASGFSRIFAKKMNNPWISYKNNLPLNSAMPFFIPHDNKIDPVTTAWAQSAGWMWMIPTQKRYGCGYVFDDNFITNEEAHKEIESVLNMEIEPIRFLKFDAGRLENLWKNNCLSIGLSAAFSEPLEATSIHTTIVQLQTFINGFLKESIQDTCNIFSINLYNKKMIKMYDDMKDFINLHYAGKRNDTKFWQWISTGEIFSESTKNIINMVNYRSIRPYDFDIYYGHAGSSLYNWILSGLGFYSKNLAIKELSLFNNENIAKNISNLQKNNLNNIFPVSIDNTSFIYNVDRYSFAS
jgi:tryptophan halogenase